jgi:hypothetical protein
VAPGSAVDPLPAGPVPVGPVTVPGAATVPVGPTLPVVPLGLPSPTVDAFCAVDGIASTMTS